MRGEPWRPLAAAAARVTQALSLATLAATALIQPCRYARSFYVAKEGRGRGVGGLLMETAGRIPRVADELTIDGLRFTIERREGTILRRVRVEPAT